MCTVQHVPSLTHHRNSRLRIWKLSAPMSQSIEVVGCRVAGRPNGELWDFFDQLSLDAYIQLHPIRCNAPHSLYHCIATFSSIYIFFFLMGKFPNVINFNLIDFLWISKGTLSVNPKGFAYTGL